VRLVWMFAALVEVHAAIWGPLVERYLASRPGQ
jgi:hypothetical protein